MHISSNHAENNFKAIGVPPNNHLIDVINKKTETQDIGLNNDASNNILTQVNDATQCTKEQKENDLEINPSFMSPQLKLDLSKKVSFLSPESFKPLVNFQQFGSPRLQSLHLDLNRIKIKRDDDLQDNLAKEVETEKVVFHETEIIPIKQSITSENVIDDLKQTNENITEIDLSIAKNEVKEEKLEPNLEKQQHIKQQCIRETTICTPLNKMSFGIN